MKAPLLESIKWDKTLENMLWDATAHQTSRWTRWSFRLFTSLKSGEQTSIATGNRGANRHILSSRTPVSQEEKPCEQDQDGTSTAVSEALTASQDTSDQLSSLGLAYRPSIARHNPKQTAKLSPKLGKAHPTATLLLINWGRCFSSCLALSIEAVVETFVRVLQPGHQCVMGLTLVPNRQETRTSPQYFKLEEVQNAGFTASACKTAVPVAASSGLLGWFWFSVFQCSICTPLLPVWTPRRTDSTFWWNFQARIR